MDDIELIRKLASAETGRRYLEERFAPVEDPYVIAHLQKAASADQELLSLAAWAAGDTHDALENYEALGGEFKEARARPLKRLLHPAGPTKQITQARAGVKGIDKEKGLVGRVGQLLTGSRAKALEEHAGNLQRGGAAIAGRQPRNALLAERHAGRVKNLARGEQIASTAARVGTGAALVGTGAAIGSSGKDR